MENKINKRINNNLKRSNGTLTIKQLKNAYEFFERKCPYSETPITEENWHLEHIIPVVMGGTTDSWNCIPVCGPCNLSKGGKHLLDWWDENHEPIEEKKIEKVFNYIINELEKPHRDYKISTKEKEQIEQLLLVAKEEESLDDEYQEDNNLDTFTFLYQMLSHLNQNKEYIKGDISEYEKRLDKVYEKNNEFEKQDKDIFILQNDFTNYLKEIGIIRHYSIPVQFRSKKLIKSDEDLRIIKNNVESLDELLSNKNKFNIIEILNKNPYLMLDNIETIQNKINYVIKECNISIDFILDKPNILNSVEELKDLINVCNEVNFDIKQLPDYIFVRRKISEIREILRSEEYKEHPEMFTSTTLAHAKISEIREILRSEEYKEHPELFTSETLAHAKISEIREILKSEEYKEHPELFTSQTLAHAKISEIREILRSEEYKEWC